MPKDKRPRPAIPYIQNASPAIGSRVKVWFDKVSKDLLIESETGAITRDIYGICLEDVAFDTESRLAAQCDALRQDAFSPSPERGRAPRWNVKYDRPRGGISTSTGGATRSGRSPRRARPISRHPMAASRPASPSIPSEPQTREQEMHDRIAAQNNQRRRIRHCVLTFLLGKVLLACTPRSLSTMVALWTRSTWQYASYRSGPVNMHTDRRSQPSEAASTAIRMFSQCS